MNFDLKRSWLGATLVQKGRAFFFFYFCVCMWGGLCRGGVVDMTTVASPAFRGHRYELTGKSLHFLGNGRIRKVAMDNRDHCCVFFLLLKGLIHFWDVVHSK